MNATLFYNWKSKYLNTVYIDIPYTKSIVSISIHFIQRLNKIHWLSDNKYYCKTRHFVLGLKNQLNPF